THSPAPSAAAIARKPAYPAGPARIDASLSPVFTPEFCRTGGAERANWYCAASGCRLPGAGTAAVVGTGAAARVDTILPSPGAGGVAAWYSTGRDENRARGGGDGGITAGSPGGGAASPVAGFSGNGHSRHCR